MAGEQIRIYVSEEDAMLWNYGVALLGRDRVRRFFVKFFLREFLNSKMKAEASAERQAEARAELKERQSRKNGAKRENPTP